MKIPAPPLYNVAPVHADSGHTDGQGDNANALRTSNDINNNLAYHGYYSSHNASNSDTGGDYGRGHHQHHERLYPHDNSESHESRQQMGQAHHRAVYDPQHDQQQFMQPQRLELEEEEAKRYRQSSNLEQETLHHTSFHEDEVAPLLSTSTPSSSIKEKLLPNVFSLAQKLLPTVMKRLNHQEKKRLHQQDDDFSGTCSPLGSPVNNPTFMPFKDNLKSTGLEESDFTTNSTNYQDNEEEGTVLSADDVGMGEQELLEDDPMQYLPRSAALLVNALQTSARKSKKDVAATVVNTMESSNNQSFGNLPSLMDEAVMTFFKSSSDMSAREFFNTPTKRRQRSSANMLDMVSKEREADKLLESIRKDDLDGSGKKRRIVGGSSTRRGSQDSSNDAATTIAASASPAVAIGGTSTFDDDDGSIGGDVARLTHSIAHLQRDLENVDFSYLDDIYDDGFGNVGTALDGCDDVENGMLGRLKLWFSRGMIMEQKLLHTYVNPNNDGGNGENTDTAAAAESSGRYVDNPVLVWSMALMWAFVVLILMHPKIAELFEGQGDPGQLADIIEWLFG